MLATITSIRLPASTSLTSWIERSWPIASGVSVSGNGTVSRRGSTGSVPGIVRDCPMSTVSPSPGDGGDLDHVLSTSMSDSDSGTSMGTRRERGSGAASGSSIRSIPSR